MDEQVGTLEIFFKYEGFYTDRIKYDDFNMYSLQGGFLVVVKTDGTVDHFNSNLIDNFTYTPKEIN